METDIRYRVRICCILFSLSLLVEWHIAAVLDSISFCSKMALCRCPFRESSENSKKAPQISFLTQQNQGCIREISITAGMISIESSKIVFTFYPKILNYLPVKYTVKIKSVHFSSTFLSWYLKCTLIMEVPARFELANNGFADRGLTTWLRYHMK